MAFYRDNARWLAAGLLLMFSSSFGQTYFISLFGADIRAAFSLSHGEFGAVYTVATVASGVTLIFAGSLADRWRVATLAALIAAGLALACLSMALASGVIWLCLTIYALRFCGQGMMTHIGFTAMGRWYNRQRGKAVALASMGFPLGEGLLPPLTVAAALWIGWRETWMAGAAVLVLLLAPTIVLLTRRERRPQSPAEAAAPTGAAQPAPEPGTEADWIGTRHWTRGEAIRDPVFWGLMPGILAPSFIQTGVQFHQTHLVEVKGWTMAVFSTTYTPYAIAAVAATLASGWAIDRFTARRLLPTCLAPLALSMFVLASDDSLLVAYLGMTLMGASGGVVATLLGALWAELYGTKHLGSIRALTVAAMVFSTALAPGMMGGLIDVGVSIDVQMIAMGIYCIAVSTLFLALMPRMMARHAS